MFQIRSLICVLLLAAVGSFKFKNIINRIVSSNHPTTANFNRIIAAATGVALLTIGTPVNNVFAADLQTYKNDRFHTTISYPSNWEEKTGLLSNERTVVAFVDPSDADTSISLAFNPIPGDYTHLTSFGGKETLRQYLLPRGEGVTTEAIDESIKGESYYLEYTVSAENAPTRHVKTVFSLRPAEFVVGLTAQTKEGTYTKHKDEFAAIVSSFKVDIN